MFKNETASVTRKAERKGGKAERKGRDGNLTCERKDSETSVTSSNFTTDVLDPAQKERRRVEKNCESQHKTTFIVKEASPDPFEDDLSWLRTCHPSSSLTFNPSIEDQAIAFFFSNFVLRSRSKETSRGFSRS